jgi:hypothetical protein
MSSVAAATVAWTPAEEVLGAVTASSTAGCVAVNTA